MIVGRVDPAGSGDFAGQAAFALSIDPDTGHRDVRAVPVDWIGTTEHDGSDDDTSTLTLATPPICRWCRR